MTKWLGIDVGGANLKVSDGLEFAKSVPFELWRQPELLSEAVESLLADAPLFDALAATMTGELADCYETKAAGVRHITSVLLQANANRPLQIYCVDGRFRESQRVMESPLLAAASNWHALARFASRQLPERTGLVVDVGSTTSDIIPVVRGEVVTASQTDTDRLLAGELVYSGVARTPLSAIVRELPYRGKFCPVSAELFATTLDVYQVLGELGEGTAPTADGRSACVEHCVDRLARQVCADRETFSLADARQASQYAKEQQLSLLRAAVAKVAEQFAGDRVSAIVSGSGEVVAREVLSACEGVGNVVSLSAVLGDFQSHCAAAAAVASLAGGGGMNVATEVVKVGGSLLTRHDFVPAIRSWLDRAKYQHPDVHRILLIGGGPLVDALRRLDAATPMDKNISHWQAIRLMQISGQIVGRWLPDWPLVDSFADLCGLTAEPGCSLFLAEEFMHTAEPQMPGSTLPVGWQVTSDSIAARLAICLGADRLVLLKSREAMPGERSDWAQAVAGGLVDGCFPTFAAKLPEVRLETLPPLSPHGPDSVPVR